MRTAMLSLTRRQVIIGGLGSTLAPALSFAAGKAEKLVLSGRVVDANGKPLAGVSFHDAVTDADGRFMVFTDTRAFPASNARRDAQGIWRATCGITLA
jgi:protocatechuate 3,4-dioxygenase beta subunit